MRARLFCASNCKLGEAPLWHPVRGSIFWLDILRRKLYEKHVDSTNTDPDNRWDLPEYVSALAIDPDREGGLWMLGNHSFFRFDLSKGTHRTILSLCLADGIRTNDAGVSPSGHFFFGTMAWQALPGAGDVFSISPAGTLRRQNIPVAIPNTFCWTKTGKLLLSDSFFRVISQYSVQGSVVEKESRVNFSCLPEEYGVPDGGAMDERGNLFNARWDAGSVAEFDPDGLCLEFHAIPVPRPTSCCFGGEDMRKLFVTSASDGLSRGETSDNSLSGGVFVLDMKYPGVRVPGFRMDV